MKWHLWAVIISESLKWCAESHQESETELQVPPNRLSPSYASVLTRLLTPFIPINEARENAMFFPDSRRSLRRTESYIAFLLLLATSPAPVRTFPYTICFKLFFYLVKQMCWLPSWIFPLDTIQLPYNHVNLGCDSATFSFQHNKYSANISTYQQG